MAEATIAGPRLIAEPVDVGFGVQDADRQGAFPPLGDDQIELLRARGTERSVEAGELLFREGDRSYDFIVLLEGAVAIVEGYGTADEREVTVHGKRRFLGELNLLTGQGLYLTAVVREPGRVLTVPVAELRRVIAEEPTLSDTIVRAFLLRRALLQASGVGLRIVGSKFSPDTRRLLEFVARNRLPSTWIDLETEPGAEQLLRDAGVGVEDTPVVIWQGAAVLRNPTLAELAEAIGVRAEPAPDGADVYDVAVVGAGPAGLAAAVYGASEGLRTIVCENVAVGGQAGTSTRIENYLGFPAGVSGTELAERAVLQAEKFGARITSPCEAVSLDRCAEGYVVRLADGDEVRARAVVVATGAAYRRLDVPALEQHEGTGVFYAATQAEALLCGGSAVVVVGGGNSAGQAAMFLADRVRHVHLLIRREALDATMSRYLIDQVGRHPRVTVHARTELRDVRGDDGRIEAVVTACDGAAAELDASGVFVFIGADAHTGWLKGAVELDEHGFVLTGGDGGSLLETSAPGVFAVGDVRAGSLKRVASAVGEGAAAIRLVHQRLTLVASA